MDGHLGWGFIILLYTGWRTLTRLRYGWGDLNGGGESFNAVNYNHPLKTIKGYSIVFQAPFYDSIFTNY